MEGAGTGGYNLEGRITHLERAYTTLSEDYRHLREDSSNIKGLLAGIATTLEDVQERQRHDAEKLDAARTEKPDFQSWAAFAAVVIMVWGLSLAPLYRDVFRNEEELQRIETVVNNRNAVIEQYDADREHILTELAEIEEALRGVLGSRFTNDDGERLEQRLIEHLESHLAGELDRHD
jgi:hypothetical protein